MFGTAIHAAEIDLEPCDISATDGRHEVDAQCGTLEVPLDPDDPDGETIELFIALVRALAEQPSPDPLVVIAGGPGEAATRFYVTAEHAFSRIVRQRDILLIDQHVAHERVLFERISERLTTGRLESQRLLEPLVLQLAPAGREALLAHAADVARLGFEVDDFGGDALRVSAMPAVLETGTCEGTLQTLAEDLEGLDRGATAEEALRNLAARMACHAAVKANDPLTPEKIIWLLAELRRTAYSTICPHGRPVMLRLTRKEIERAFERI